MRNEHLPTVIRNDSLPATNRNGCFVKSSGPAMPPPFGLRRTLLGMLAGAGLAFLVDLAVDLRALAAAFLS